MKILWYTDTHFGHSGAFSRPSASGYTTRLDETLELHQWISSKVKELRPDLVIHGGDIYKPQVTLHGMEVSASTRGTNRVIKESPLHITLLGNHDYISRDTRVTAVDWLNEQPNSKLIKTIDYMDFAEDPGLCLIFCPFVWDYSYAANRIKELSQGYDRVFFFGHAEVQGALNSIVMDLGSGEREEYKATSANALSPAFLSQFRLAFNGHHHIPQKPKENVYLTGSTQQFTVTEYAHDQKRGIYLIDTDQESVDFFENTITPEIALVKDNSSQLEELPNNTYVIYYYNANKQSREELDPLFQRFKGHKLKPFGSDKFKPITTIEFESQEEDHIGIYREYLETVAFESQTIHKKVSKKGELLIKKAEENDG